ncbi:MAG: dihydroorotase [Chloroflexota bacterium]|nr:dihydroorotase [Chloroflexota bacterium]
MINRTYNRPVLIKGARIVDPGRGIDVVGDALTQEGRIVSAGPTLTPSNVPDGTHTIPANGLVVAPGFIDLHAHLREPGYEYKETIATGTQAAARGGFTSLCCMPNTDPAIDNEAMVELVKRRVESDAVVRVFPIGAVTKGRKGRELSEMEELAAAGVVAYSDDGDPVYDPNIMRLALTYTLDLGMPVINHCQENGLCCGGVMAEGWIATRLGLPGIPAAAEEAMVSRDLALAEMTGGWLHLAHLSTAGSVDLVRQARQRGVSVTCEVCPQHLYLTDEWALGYQGSLRCRAGSRNYDTSTKVYPPLRTRSDVEALIVGLAEGVIDCIATDHAPHEVASKEVTYEEASFGISVLETALGSLLSLVHGGRISMSALVDRLTVGPARVLGPSFEKYATLEAGSPADLVLFDPNLEWTVDTSQFASKGRNTPLQGVSLKGRVMATMVDGRLVHQDFGV